MKITFANLRNQTVIHNQDRTKSSSGYTLGTDVIRCSGYLITEHLVHIF